MNALTLEYQVEDKAITQYEMYVLETMERSEPSMNLRTTFVEDL